MDIMHRDLKSANIFVDAQNNAKLGDMNVSKIAKMGLVIYFYNLLYKYTYNRFTPRRGRLITPRQRSGKVRLLFIDEPYGFKSDLWSLGCIVYELACLKPPFRAKSLEVLYEKVIKGKFYKLG